MYRDLKPENILLDSKGNIKLADFGISKIFEKSSETKNNLTDSFIGTAEYMAPEVFDKNSKYCSKIDIWAFGCCLYEMVVGNPPFTTCEKGCNRKLECAIR